jgi:hypothetical protein
MMAPSCRGEAAAWNFQRVKSFCKCDSPNTSDELRLRQQQGACDLKNWRDSSRVDVMGRLHPEVSDDIPVAVRSSCTASELRNLHTTMRKNQPPQFP